MNADLAQKLSDYFYDVFITNFDAWVILGFAAQAMFTARFLVQWIATERARASVIPISFWFFSVAGGFLLLIYALYRRDPVFIAGQAFGLIVYLRNLYFIVTHARQPALDGKAG